MPPLVVDDAPDSEEAEEETTVLLALALALVVVELVLQSPGDIMPYRHLQDLEHRLPGVPLSSPSSHSSPNSESVRPLPQPTGVAPREMM